MEVNQTPLKLAMMLKEQTQICKGLEKEVNQLRAKYEAARKELKQVRQESEQRAEQHNQEAKARAQASRAWDMECVRRFEEWDAAQTAYKTQLTDNGAWGWEV